MQRICPKGASCRWGGNGSRRPTVPLRALAQRGVRAVGQMPRICPEGVSCRWGGNESTYMTCLVWLANLKSVRHPTSCVDYESVRVMQTHSKIRFLPPQVETGKARLAARGKIFAAEANKACVRILNSHTIHPTHSRAPEGYSGAQASLMLHRRSLLDTCGTG